MAGIHSVAGMEVGDLYTTDGKDVWVVESFFDLPSVTMTNVRTGDSVNGAVGFPILGPFVKLKPAEPLAENPDIPRCPSYKDGIAAEGPNHG